MGFDVIKDNKLNPLKFDCCNRITGQVNYSLIVVVLDTYVTVSNVL